MLARHVIFFGVLATLLASYSSIYHDAYDGVAIPACVINISSILLLTDFCCFSIWFLPSPSSIFDLIYESCVPVRFTVL